MDSKICFILFGIVILTDGKPASDESSFLVSNEGELQQLLKTLYNDGKYDISLSHHEDSPKSHHVDTARISVHDENSQSRDHHATTGREHRYRESSKKHKHTDEEIPALANIQNLNLFLRSKSKNTDDNYFNEAAGDASRLTSQSSDKSINNVDQILDLLRQVGSDNRCEGGRCGNSRSNDDKRDDNDLDESFRNGDNRDCAGDRCGHGRLDSERADDDDSSIFQLNREDDNEEGDERNNRDDQNVEERADCAGGSCSRNRDDSNRDDDDDSQDVLRCFGNTCARLTKLRERRLPDGNPRSIRDIQPNAQKIKINDDLDAIVLNLGDLEKSLGKTRINNQNNEQSEVQYLKDVDLSNLLQNKNDDEEEAVKVQDGLDSESKTIEAVVIDLSKVQNDPPNQISDLVKKLATSSKRLVKSSYSNKDIILPRGESKILSHDENNNNVYVPKWLLNEVVAKKQLQFLEQKLKYLIPLTTKPKKKLNDAAGSKKNPLKRIFRRSLGDDVGVPFHLQIEGLGQAEA